MAADDTVLGLWQSLSRRDFDAVKGYLWLEEPGKADTSWIFDATGLI